MLMLFLLHEQSLDEDISKNHVDLDKMKQVLTSFPSTSHLELNTGKMEHELHEMEANVHTLTARIQVPINYILASLKI